MLRSAHARLQAPRSYDLLTSPGADIRDAGQADLDAMRAELNTHLYAFCWIIMGSRWFTPDYHGVACSFLEKWGEPGWNRLMLALARDSGKTTMARGLSLWTVCRSVGHNATVALWNAKEDNSKKWLRAIRQVVESSRPFHFIYQDMIPPGIAAGDDRPLPKRWKWNDDQIEFVRDGVGIPESSITALGIGGAATGGHWSHNVKDDIIGRDESLSEADMAYAVNWCDTARYMESPAEKGNDLFIYTPWHHADVYRYVQEKWGDEYICFKRPILERDELGNEVSALPERWTTEELQRERERDSFTFASQRMLSPRPGRAQAFHDEWVQTGVVTLQGRRALFTISPDCYDPHRHRLDSPQDKGAEAPQSVPLQAMSLALLWDPAPSEGELAATDVTRSHNGMVVVGRDAYWRDFVLQSLATLLDPLDTIRLVIRTCLAWGCRTVVTEEVNFAKLYKHFVDYVLRAEFPTTQLEWRGVPHPKGQKDLRVQGLIPDTKAGHIYYNEPLTEVVRQEMREYLPGFKKGIDCLDALAMKDLPGVLPRPQTTMELFRTQLEEERRHRPVRGGRAYDATHWAAGGPR